MADFIDYNAYAEANAPEEERQLADAYARAEAADAQARQALAKSRNEASGSYDQRGQLVGGVDDISKTGSFSDFLKFQQEAAMARSRATQALGEDPRRQALRRDMAKRTGTGDRLDAMGKSLEGQAGAAANSVREGAAGRERIRAEDAERRRLADEQAAGRAAQERAARDAYSTSINSRLEDFRKSGAPVTNFGPAQANELAYLWQASNRFANSGAGADYKGQTQGALEGLDKQATMGRGGTQGEPGKAWGTVKGGWSWDDWMRRNGGK